LSSRGKTKTTMAKLTRESRLRERRQDKQARKDARRQAALNGESQPIESAFGDDLSSIEPSDDPSSVEPSDDPSPAEPELSSDSSPLPLS
jgi:hypothetical protein